MQSRRNRLLVMAILLCVLCRVANAQALTTEVDTLSDTIVKMELPSAYKKSKFMYDEGVFIDYCYSGGAVITLFKGALQHTPLYSNEPDCLLQSADTVHDRVSYRGIAGSRVWREMKIGSLHVFYTNVLPVEKNLFDQCLESISIQSDVNRKQTEPLRGVPHKK